MSVPHLGRARMATNAFFLICGVAMACWAAMVPYAKIRMNLTDSQTGLVLLALGAGAIVTMPFAGIFINRYGSRTVMLISALCNACALVLLTVAPTAPVLAVVLFLFGAGIGVLDVSMNAHAVVVEGAIGRPIMSSMHGLYSVGGIVGALGVTALLARGTPLVICMAGVAATASLLGLWQFRRLLPHSMDPRIVGSALIVPRGLVLLFGILTFIAFMAEGAVLDWSAIFLHFQRGVPEARAGIAYAIFSVTMAAGRLTGDWVTHRLGSVNTLRAGSLLAIAGYAVVVTVPGPLAAILGFGIAGLGLSNLVPVIFSALGRLADPPPSVSIPVVTTIGYAGLLSGPAAIGFASDAVSLPIALGGVALTLLLILASARAVKLPPALAQSA